MSVHDDLWKRQSVTYEGKPHGWIQWKGTSVCMDLHCECGASTHFDCDFAYAVRCGSCRRTYYVNGHVEMVPMSKDEEAHWELDCGYSTCIREGKLSEPNPP